jgi:hypothetical protein
MDLDLNGARVLGARTRLCPSSLVGSPAADGSQVNFRQPNGADRNSISFVGFFESRRKFKKPTKVFVFSVVKVRTFLGT